MTAQSVSSDGFGEYFARNERRFQRLAVGPWIDWVILAMAMLVCFATPLLLTRATRLASETQSLLALAVVAACALASVWLSLRLRTLCVALVGMVRRTPLWTIVAAGLLLRL